MNTKHRILSVLLILAMVATLCVVMAAPASADVSSVVWGPVAGGTLPFIKGDATDIYTVSFVTTQPLGTFTTVRVDDFATITFPSLTTLAVIGTETVTAGGGNLVAVGGAAGTVGIAVSTNSMVLTVNGPAAAGAPTIPGGATVIVTLVAGTVTNGMAIGSQTLTVRTSKEGTSVASNPVTICGIAVTGGAVPTLPTNAPAGTTMTAIGAGYTPGQSVDVLAGATLAAAQLVGSIGSATVGADGTFTAAISQQAVAANYYAVDGSGVGSVPLYNAVAFVVTPTVTATPATGIVASTVQISVSGLAVSTNYAVGFGGVAVDVPAAGITTGATVVAVTTLNGITSTAAGLAVFTITVPVGSSIGAKTIVLKASGAAPGFANQAAFAIPAANGSGTFTVANRSITLSPASLRAGTVTVTGAGFSAFAVALNSTVVSAPALVPAIPATTRFTTDGNGSFTTSFSVPLGTAAGNYAVTCTDSNGARATAILNIPAAPALVSSLTPATGATGSTCTAVGSGFAALSTMTVQFTPPLPGAQTIVATGTTDSNGGCSIQFVIPLSAPGFARITMTDGNGTANFGTYTVTAGPVSVAVTDGFSTVAGKYSVIWTFNAATQDWQLYDTTAGAVNSLTILARGQGYWMNITQDCTLTYGVNTYSLKAGWNLIGWLG